MTRALRRLALAALLSGLAAVPGAMACDAVLIQAALDESDGQLASALAAGSLEGARTHLRRLAHVLDEAEMQMISCGCPAAQIEVAAAAREARRAAEATEFDEMQIAVEAAVVNFRRTLLALEDDLCI